MSEHLIVLKNICKTFNAGTIDEKILFNNFNFNINSGDFIAYNAD